MRYIQPILQFDGVMPADAYRLAGGLCWFDHVQVLGRDAMPQIMRASGLSEDELRPLIATRADICGLEMVRPHIMGILNVTPDSFQMAASLMTRAMPSRAHVKWCVDGATIIDIGGESTRPGAAEVPVDAEIARTSPVIAALAPEIDVPISIDTRKAAVAVGAMKAGAGIINDVAAMTFDPGIAAVAADTGAPMCLMHAQGDPETMQADPKYDHVLLDVYDFLSDRIAVAEAAGIARDRIVVDPGIGFGKTTEHNLELLRGLALFHSLGCPILLGASRKRFIGALGGGEAATDRVAGSLAVALHGLRQGVQITRVHDTFETKQAFDLAMAINGTGIQ